MAMVIIFAGTGRARSPRWPSSGRGVAGTGTYATASILSKSICPAELSEANLMAVCVDNATRVLLSSFN